MDHKDVIPILEAHIFSVCPSAIPILPRPSKNASEEEVMEALGMAKDKKTGDYEAFDRFLARTEVRPSLTDTCTCVDLVCWSYAWYCFVPTGHRLAGGGYDGIESG